MLKLSIACAVVVLFVCQRQHAKPTQFHNDAGDC